MFLFLKFKTKKQDGSDRLNRVDEDNSFENYIQLTKSHQQCAGDKCQHPPNVSITRVGV